MTAADPSTGTTYRFHVKDKAALGKLKVGEKVSIAWGGPTMRGSLKLSGGEAVGIVSVGGKPAAPVKAKVSPIGPVDAARITAIDAAKGLVTAKTPAGRVLQFEVKDQALLRGLKIGQDVYADFTGMKVSLKPAGAAPCCPIVGAAAAGAVR